MVCFGFGYKNTSSHSFVIIFGMAFNGDDGFCFGYDIDLRIWNRNNAQTYNEPWSPAKYMLPFLFHFIAVSSYP